MLLARGKGRRAGDGPWLAALALKPRAWLEAPAVRPPAFVRRELGPFAPLAPAGGAHETCPAAPPDDQDQSNQDQHGEPPFRRRAGGRARQTGRPGGSTRPGIVRAAGSSRGATVSGPSTGGRQ